MSVFVGITYFSLPMFVANIVSSEARFSENNKESLYLRALEWYPKHKESLSHLSVISLEQKEYEKAAEYALKALQQDPTNGRTMSVMITALDALGDEEKAKKAVELATQLWPSHAYVRIQSADFWSKRGDIQNVLKEWDVLLSRHNGFYKDIFPILKILLEDENTSGVLDAYAEKPAAWWGDFFAYLSKQAFPLDKLAALYQQRLKSEDGLELNERNAYIRRLIKERNWVRAYSAWMGGLSKSERKHVALVYDGGFEATTKPSAFSWHYRNKAHARIRLNRIRGAKGQKAFKLDFKKTKPITASVLTQRLMLQEGKSYGLSFIAQLMSLKNPQGLEWSIRCESERKSIASSQPLTGREKKAEYDFEFFVPEGDCRTQMLELKPVSRFHHERFFQGSVWFDEISIKPLLKKGQGDE